MNRTRKRIYKQLREVRRERDYQSGTIQYANRPYTFPSSRIRTTKQFIKSPIYQESKYKD